MANILTIDLDNLMDDPERGQRIAAMILSFIGIEPHQEITQEATPLVLRQVVKATAEQIENYHRFGEPAEAFGSIENKVPPPPPPPAAPVSNLGPTLVIPNPSTSAPTVVTSTQAETVAGVAASALPPTSVPTASNPNFDVKGLPWDQRIHSSQRTFNADGTWRMKRGIEKALATSVEAELHQLMAIPSPTAVVTVAPPPPPPPSSEPVILPPADAKTLAASEQAYLELMTKVSSALAQGRLKVDQLATLCDGVGLPNFASLGIRLDLVPKINPLIDALLAANAEG